MMRIVASSGTESRATSNGESIVGHIGVCSRAAGQAGEIAGQPAATARNRPTKLLTEFPYTLLGFCQVLALCFSTIHLFVEGIITGTSCINYSPTFFLGYLTYFRFHGEPNYPSRLIKGEAVVFENWNVLRLFPSIGNVSKMLKLDLN